MNIERTIEVHRMETKMLPEEFQGHLNDAFVRTLHINQLLQDTSVHSISIDFNGRDVINCKGGPRFCYPVGKSLDFYAKPKDIKLRFRVYDGHMEVRDGLTVYDNGSPYYNPKCERLVVKTFPITLMGLDKLLELAFAYRIKGPNNIDYSSLAIKNYNGVLSEVERVCTPKK